MVRRLSDWVAVPKLLTLVMMIVLLTGGVATAGELSAASGNGAKELRPLQGAQAGVVRSDGEVPMSAQTYEGSIRLTSHTHNATYTYTEGRTVRVSATAQDPDNWGYYLVGIRIWDKATNTAVRSYWSDEYVYLSESGYADVDLTGLAVSSGRYRVEALLWDDYLNLFEDGKWFNLNIVADKPTATIDLVTPNPATVGSSVQLTGHGTDTANHAFNAFEWRSSIDGPLSTSQNAVLSGLSVGTHTVYFKVMCSNGKWSSEVSKTLVVNSHEATMTTAVIATVSPNPVNVGSTVSFSGNATDTAGHDIASYQWRSSKNGVLSTAAAFSTSALSEGTHTIYFKALCSDGTWSPEVSRTLTIRSKNAYVKSVGKSTGTWSRSWSKYRLSPSYTKLTIGRSKSYVKLTPYREHSGATIYMKLKGGSYAKVSYKKVYVSRGRSKTVYIKCVPQAGSGYAKTYKIIVARRS